MLEKRIQIQGQDTNYLVRDDGTIFNEKTRRLLKGTTQRNEYRSVQLSFQGKPHDFMVHRLVAEAFCDNPNNYTIVHHKDENKLNNCAENLEWVDNQKNMLASVASRKKKTSSLYYYDEFIGDDWKIYEPIPNYMLNKNGMIVSLRSKRILIPTERNGYLRINLTMDNKTYKLSLHRMLYETFIGPIPVGMCVDHIDGNRANNNLSNLRLVTQSDNMCNAMKNGHSCQIPVLQFDKQGNFIQEFQNIQAAANAVGVTHAAIRSAIERNGTCRDFKWKRKS